MSADLILVRHAAPRIDPQVPPPQWRLSDEGRVASAALAERLTTWGATAVAASPEPKARETAEIIARRLGLAVAIDEGFAEHRRPALPFVSREDFEARMRAVFDHPADPFVGGESGVEALTRFEAALARHMGRPLLVASHGTVISLYLGRRLGIDPYALWSGLALPEAFVLDAAGRLLERVAPVTPA